MTDSNGQVPDNKHIHDAVIKEWAEDTGKTLQYINCGNCWHDYTGDGKDPNLFDETYRWRIKPREFEVGAYYPAVKKRDGHILIVRYMPEDSSKPFICSPERGQRWKYAIESLEIGEKLEIQWPNQGEQ